MAPRAIGPYRVMETLGRGGTGVVLRCLHATTGEPAAVKTSQQGTTEDCQALRREIGILSRLGRSRIRGAVRIFEHGTEQGIPWYAMELLTGHSLRFWAERLWAPMRAPMRETREAVTRTVSLGETADERGATRVEPRGSASERGAASRVVRTPERLPCAAGQLERVLHVLLRIAETLAQIHGEGVVHGDLTPRNVVFRDETDPVLIDFGMALADFEPRSFRELPSGTRAALGTPGYLAPELVAGETVDARCDLYALGCIAYELFAGVPPFTGDRPADLLRQHASVAPPPPSRFVANLPSGLESLVLGLLEKQPTRRIASALDACHVLREHMRERPKVLRAVRSEASLYRPRLHGRHGVLAQLEAAVARLEQGRGGLAVVAGPSGIGKTRLMNELGRRANRKGALVVWCRARRLSTSEAGGSEVTNAGLELFRPVLEELHDMRCRAEPRLSGPEVAAAFDALDVLAPRSGAEASQATGSSDLSPEEARRRGLAAFALLLERVAPPAGLVVLLDDVHWADGLSLLFLREHARALTESRVLLLANHRIEAARTRELLGDAAFLELELGSLGASDIRAMARDLLSTHSLPEELFEFLQRHSGGNPFFVAEYTRAALAKGILERRPGGAFTFDVTRAAAIDVPSSIEGLLALRVATLSPAARAALPFACVLGSEFDVDAFRMLGLDDVDPSEVLEELVARDVLAATSPGRYRFSHDKLREAQERVLLPEERQRYHRRVAEHLEKGGSPWMENRHAALGYHLAAAGEPRRALEHLVRAAEEAAKRHALEQAAELRSSAVRQAELLAESEGQAALAAQREALAGVLVTLARHTEARACLERALDVIPEHDRLTRARVLRKLAASYWTQHDYAAADDALERAERELGTPQEADGDAWAELIQIRLGRFERLYFAGKTGPALEALVANLGELVERRGTDDQRCVYYFTAASAIMLARRYAFASEAVALAERGLVAAQALPAHRRALAHFILAFARMLGSKEDCRAALSSFERAAVYGESTGEVTLLSRIRTYHAMTLLRTGEVDATETAARIALVTAEGARLAPYVAAATACRGWVAWQRGDDGEARALLESARATWAAHPHKFPLRNIVAFPLLDLASARDDLAEAARLLAEIEEGFPALPGELDGVVAAAARAVAAGSPREAWLAVGAAVSTARAFGFA